MNLVAADVSPLHLPLGKVRADSRRLLRFRGSRREVFRGILSLNQSTPAPSKEGSKAADARRQALSRGTSVCIPRGEVVCATSQLVEDMLHRVNHRRLCILCCSFLGRARESRCSPGLI